MSKKNAKTTSAEHKLRIWQIYRLILRGCDRPEILKYGGDKWGPICDTTIDGYIAKAREWIYKLCDEKAERAMKLSKSRRLNLFNRALESGNLLVAHEILRDLDKLFGRYPDEKHHHTLNGNVTPYSLVVQVDPTLIYDYNTGIKFNRRDENKSVVPVDENKSVVPANG